MSKNMFNERRFRSLQVGAVSLLIAAVVSLNNSPSQAQGELAAVPGAGGPLSRAKSARNTAKEIVSMKGAATKSFQTDDGSVLTDFYSRPIHFRSNGRWEDIDLNLYDQGDHFQNGRHELSLSLPKSADGTFRSLKNGKGYTVRFVDAASVPGVALGDGHDTYDKNLTSNVVTYPDIYTGVDLRVENLSRGIERDIVFKSADAAPSVEVEIEPLGLSLENSAASSLVFNDVNGEYARLNTFAVNTRDPLGRESQPQIEKRLDGNRILLTIRPPSDAIYPYTVDPSDFFTVTGSTAGWDGHLGRDNGGTNTWSDIHGGSTADHIDDTATYMSGGYGCDNGTDMYIYRTSMNFLTGTTLNGRTVVSASLDVWPVDIHNDYDTVNQYMNVAHFTGSTSGAASGDYNKYDGLTGTIEKEASDVLFSNITSTTSATTTFVLNTSGLGKVSTTSGGYTQLGLTSKYDFENVDEGCPGHRSYIAFGTADSNRPPRLSVLSISSTPTVAGVTKVRKSTDQSVTSQTTLLADDQLRLRVATTTIYIVDAAIFVEASSTVPDLKISFDAPAGSEVDLAYMATNTQQLLSNGQTSNTIDLSANTPLFIHVGGTIKTSSTAGDLNFNWAQATSDSSRVTILKGSYLRIDSVQ